MYDVLLLYFLTGSYISYIANTHPFEIGSAADVHASSTIYRACEFSVIDYIVD